MRTIIYRIAFFSFLFFSSLVTAAQTENCTNGIDDDADGFVDFFDPDCACSPNNFFGLCTSECLYTAGYSTFQFEQLWASADDVPTYNTPQAADIDNDGVPEIITMAVSGSFNTGTPRRTSNILILNGPTGVTERTIITPVMAWSGPMAMAIGDIDGDGFGEIIIASSDDASNNTDLYPAQPGTNDRKYLYCYEHDGTLKWKSSVQYGVSSANDYGGAVGLADFNQDGNAEVYIFNEIFNARTGVKLADGSAASSNIGRIESNALLGDNSVTVAADFRPAKAGLELAAGNAVYEVTITNPTGTAGNTMTAFTLTGTGLVDGFTSVADIDLDRQLDIVVTTQGATTGKLYVWNPRTVSLIAQVLLPNGGGGLDFKTGYPFIGDMDNDDAPEIGVTRSNLVMAYEYNGSATLQQKWQLATSDASGETGITMFDFNQDGNYELVYRDMTNLRVLNGSGATVLNIQNVGCNSGTGNEMPIIADVNGDGDAEIIVTCDNGADTKIGKVRVYQSQNRPWAPARRVWNQYAYFAVNVNDNLSIPRQQQNHAVAFSAGISLNNILVQATLFDKNGGFVFPAADATFLPTVSAVNVSATQISINFTLVNTPKAATNLAAGTRVAFFNGDPNLGGALLGTYVTPQNIAPGGQLSGVISLPYSGVAFTLYMVANNDGNPTPITLDNYGQAECDYTNNSISALVGDRDGDGVPDQVDIDDDNDGIPDVTENGGSNPQADADSDGIPNVYDRDFAGFVDVNNDGVNDAFDKDLDGLPNFIDLDSDNDGIMDLWESRSSFAAIAGLDANADGILDGPFGTNGLDNRVETAVDNGFINYTLANTDGDGVADFLDLDSDNDGINDVTESGFLYPDTNGDGIVDGTDTDGDGIVSNADANPVTIGAANLLAPRNTDGDGVVDFRDLDSDNDGLNDVRENNGADTNGDGLADGTDTDNDGIRSSADGNSTAYGNAGQTQTDTDKDGVPDFLDLDSDNDGINDVREAFATNNDTDNNGFYDGTDTDGDGIVGTADGASGTFGDSADAAPIDTDTDTVADYRDLDSDNDSVNDIVENGNAAQDANTDGLVDGTDTDRDGIRDLVDGNNGTFADAADPVLANTDGTDTPNFRDLDSDNNGTFDIDQAGNGNLDNGAAIGDGRVDDTTDPDRDGIVGGADGNPVVFGDNGDTDGDGIADLVDVDDDNDGILDTVEGGGTNPGADADGDGIPNYADPSFAGFVDLNGDGINDTFDKDLDGIPNHLDLDSDNDGVNDLRESGLSATQIVSFDTNRDGVLDGPFGANGYDNRVETALDNGAPVYMLANTDGDLVPDFLDLDSDNDGINDVRENNGLDANGDGLIDGMDGDGDGIRDAADGNPSGFGEGSTGDAAVAVDTDGDGVADYRDLDSDNDGINDVRETNNAAFDTNNDGKIDGSDSGQTDTDRDGIFSGVDGSVSFGDSGDAVPVNTDGDSIADFRDLDSDNDGINDVREAFTTNNDTNGDGFYDGTDTDGDGIVGAADGFNGFGDAADPAPTNTDGDFVADYRDLDSDNDSINDVTENNGTDANGDGLADGTDTDRDGILSSADGNPASFGDSGDAAPTNTDTDAVADFRDLDSDNDGINDVVENGGDNFDVDNNGTVDGSDVDRDGLLDIVDGDDDTFGDAGDTTVDTDSDGVKDYRDLDSDNDGINDVREAFTTNNDTNGDGFYDGTDTDGDGIVGSADSFNGFGDASDPSPVNTDGDFVADYRDLDSDNDSVNDVTENNGTDANGDGLADGTDTDRDGILSSADGNPASFGDSGDAAPVNTDGTDVPNFRDLDSDNNGTFDIDQAGNGSLDNGAAIGDGRMDDTTDPDRDGIVGAADGKPAFFGDGGDTDGDGILDSVDVDDDNDGILDTAEGLGVNPGADADGDGIPNYADPSFAGFVDMNGDGINDTFDRDLDGIPNHLDLDSDNDGITDLVESGLTTAQLTSFDANRDGVLDGPFGTNGYDNRLETTLDNGTPIYTVSNKDGDGAGFPDFLDLDSDNDGLTDLRESGYTSVDTNDDGMIDGADSDKDGIRDAADANDALFGQGANGDTRPLDTDGDGVADYRDLDSDNDGINDVREANINDPDGNGNAGTGAVPALDGQGKVSFATSTAWDTDRDGVADYRDLDSDNDGINDVRETNNAAFDTNNDGKIDGSDSGQTDTDRDGIFSGVDGSVSFGDSGDAVPVNTDGDFVADYRDLDSDNDSVNDVTENSGTDANGDGLADGTDADGDGIFSSADGNPASFGDSGDAAPVNTDGMDAANYRDLDSDNNGTFDIDQAGNGSLDNGAAIGDGRIDSTTDNDRDGIVSVADGNDTVFGDAPFVPLPVTFISFTAQARGGQILLNWVTAQEINNRYFRVERSADGKSFEQIGRVTGRNQIRLISSYQFADTRPLPGRSYYRVTQVDWDGLETFTNIASVLVEQNQYSSLSPNPATDQATLTFFSAQAQPVTISVTDGQGKLVLSRQLTKADGLFEWTFPLDGFAPGVYLVRLQAGTYQKSLKLVKH